MVGGRVGQQPGRVEKRLQALLQRRVALLPECRDHHQQRRIAAGARNADVKVAVALVLQRGARMVAEHLRQRSLQGLQVVRRGVAGGQRGGLGLDHEARVKHVERTDHRLGIGRLRLRAQRDVQHLHASADPHRHATLHLERDQRLAHRRAADAELLGQVSLGRQEAARGEISAGDRFEQHVGDVSVQALGGDRLELRRHGWGVRNGVGAGSRRSRSDPSALRVATDAVRGADFYHPRIGLLVRPPDLQSTEECSLIQ